MQVSRSGRLPTVLGRSGAKFERKFVTVEEINSLTNSEEVPLASLILLLMQELMHAFEFYGQAEVAKQDPKYKRALGEYGEYKDLPPDAATAVLLLNKYLSEPVAPVRLDAR